MSLKEKQQFGALIQKERITKKITQGELGEGIYNTTLISRIEQGKLCPERLMRDKLLERLGESCYDYETYIETEDYAEWKAQNFLLYALDTVELCQAKQLLQQYKKQYKEKCIITKQFYLVMFLQWLELTNVKKEECALILEQAVKLTIPTIDTKPISELVLSVSELNLVLEYITYQQSKKQKEQYQELFQYIQQERFDLESRALFYSKLSLYFCQYQWEQLQQWEDRAEAIYLAEEMLKVCTQGIESLRNHKKIYFAWELLQIKQEVLTFLLEEGELLSHKKIAQYKKEQEEAKAFFEVLDRLYETYHIAKHTNHYTIFYRKRAVYCINNVIRARRKMFQVDLKKLEDICSTRTIRRIENNKSNIQTTLAQQLFQRFHLSIEMQHSFLVTNSQEVIWLEKKYRIMANQEQYVEAKEVLEKLKEMVSMEHLINKQYIEYEEVYLAYKTKEILKEEFVQCAIAILEYTMPLKVALRPLGMIKFSNGREHPEEKYFTNMEITILYNIAEELEGKEKEQYFSILQEYFEHLEKETTLPPILGMYGLVMSAIASYMGNIGKYKESMVINKKVIEQSLQIRHLEYVEKNLYGLMWNEEKSKGLPEKENLERILCMQDCIVIDSYNKNKRRENWMKNRLKDILDV